LYTAVIKKFGKKEDEMIKKIFRKIGALGRVVAIEIGIFIGLTIVYYLMLLTVMYTTADIYKKGPFLQEEKTALTIIIPLANSVFAIGSRLWYKYVTLPERARWASLNAEERLSELARFNHFRG
jgi:tetrahydromethanopterin S-methyltransferase subunit G